MLPWNATSILVYDLQGKFEKNIPLNKKYEKLRVPKGRIKVDAENNRSFVALSHNTKRGAALGGILNAELLKAQGFFDNL